MFAEQFASRPDDWRFAPVAHVCRFRLGLQLELLQQAVCVLYTAGRCWIRVMLSGRGTDDFSGLRRELLSMCEIARVSAEGAHAFKQEASAFMDYHVCVLAVLMLDCLRI